MPYTDAGRRGIRILSIALMALLAVGVLSSCYPDYELASTDYDVVLTKYDPAANFGAYRTYAIAGPDTIVHIGADTTGPNAGTDPRITRKYDAQIVARVKQDMNARGYTYVPGKVDTTNPPSVVLVLAASSSTTIYSYYYYPYYGYGWGYWGWYYPPSVSYDSYTTGSLLINMIDPRKTSGLGPKLYTTVWFAGMNGLLYATSAPVERLNERIDQAFAQSPYLGAK